MSEIEEAEKLFELDLTDLEEELIEASRDVDAESRTASAEHFKGGFNKAAFLKKTLHVRQKIYL